MIKIQHLTKYYKKSRGIVDLSLDVSKGEIFGFIGPNGAGKSTTVRLLLNLIFPSAGSATISGLDIVKDTVLIRKDIGYIPSEVHLYGAMNVLKFLDYSGDFYGVEYKARQNELVLALDLDTSRKIADLSFGNKKKVAIVAALQHRPSVYILDEPTSGLDPLNQSMFFDLLRKEKAAGATIFFSSHILSEVERICDRVGIIRDGALVEVLTIEEIRQAKVKRVKLISKEPFRSASKNIKDLTVEGDTVRFLFTGSMRQLLTVLKDKSMEDLTVMDPSLEDVFMHFYERKEAA